MPFNPSTLPSLSGKTYIVTGATSGIGYYTALHLAQHSAHVYICARSASKGSTTISSLKTSCPNAQLSVLEMNHMDLSSVVGAAKHFLSRESSLNGLVNNAGIMATPFEMSKDGYEGQWQTNHLAHWVFTTHLLPVLKATAKREKDEGRKTGGVRIVNLSSSGHHMAPTGGISFADTSLKDGSGTERYGQSKLANVLHMKVLHGLYGPESENAKGGNGEIWVSAVHPGLVKSGLGDRAQLPAVMMAIFKPFQWMGAQIDGDKGSWTSVYCVASPEMKKEETGQYFQRFADPKGWQSGKAKDVELAERLEKWTREEMVRGGWVESY